MSAVLTSASAAGTDRWREAFRELAPGLPFAGNSWLDALRRRAIARFAGAGWPSNRLENWRHTSLLFLNDEQLSPTSSGEPADSAGLRSMIARLRGAEDGHWLVFVDGRVAPALSQVGALTAGAEVLAWSRADAGDSLPALFDDANDAAVESPAALNTAFATDGGVVRLARGVVVTEPVHLVFVATLPGAATHVRNLIAAAADAQVTVVEHYLGFGDALAGESGERTAGDRTAGDPIPAAATLTNAVTRIRAGAGAIVTHMKLQQEAAATVHLASLDAVQARGSRLDSHSMSFGARLSRNDIATRFDGEDCAALLNGLYHVDGRRHVDHHTRINHAKPRGSSREFYRGMLDDRGRGVFTGRIVVAPGAVRTDAVQRTDSLLLSARAETDARPELEI
jgi:Fe-S cluster assembly protein SufD